MKVRVFKGLERSENFRALITCIFEFTTVFFSFVIDISFFFYLFHFAQSGRVNGTDITEGIVIQGVKFCKFVTTEL